MQATAGPRDFTAFQQKIGSNECHRLMNKGFVVIDNFLEQEWATAILNEMKWLSTTPHMQPNKTQFSSPAGSVFQFSKPNIYELDLHDAVARKKVPELDQLFESSALSECLEDKLPGVKLVHHTNGKTLKLQRNTGSGGCFPLHYDNPGRPNKRQLTCILYLNPNWQQGDGGELQLIPFLGQSVVIAPKFDRLVIFKSDQVLHRVLPATAERYCLTIWLDGIHVNSDDVTQLRLTKSQLEDWPTFVETLQHSPLQRLLSRGVYEEEYEQSLTECMQHAEGHAEMLSAHHQHIAKLKQNTVLYQLILRLRHDKVCSTETLL